MHILRIMHLNVKEVQLKIREIKNARYFFEMFVKNMKYTINIIMLCA